MQNGEEKKAENAGRTFELDANPLNLIERQLVRCAVVQAGCARRFVGRDPLGIFECSAIAEISRYSGRPKGVAADRRRQTRLSRPPLDHGQNF